MNFKFSVANYIRGQTIAKHLQDIDTFEKMRAKIIQDCLQSEKNLPRLQSYAMQAREYARSCPESNNADMADFNANSDLRHAQNVITKGEMELKDISDYFRKKNSHFKLAWMDVLQSELIGGSSGIPILSVLEIICGYLLP